MFKRLSCLAVLLALAAVGCGSDTTKHDPVPKADSASNGVISVSEAGLHAVLRGSELDVAIPVRALMQAEGALSVELRSVDGKKVSDETSVSYSLHTGEKKSLSAHLRLPKDVVAQADRALYSVHVSEARSRPLHVTRSLLYVLTPYSLVLEGPARLRTAKPGSYRVRMEDPTTHAPLANAEVSLLLSKGDTMVKTLTGTTDADGSAVFQLDAADVGMYKVSAQTEESNAKLQLVEDLTVDAPGQKLLITTDKPIYQPGQLMHLRALALTSPDNKPVAKQSVDFDITDGKGNKVFKKSVKTDDFGIASTTFRLASLVNMGNYGVHATLGETKGEKSVSVSRYVLPKFDVKVGTDAAFYAPGAKVSGTIDARYFFGKDVGSAKVLVEALTLDVGENVFQQVMGMADKNGHTTFEVTLPGTLAGIPLQDGNALVTLRVTVTDSAGQVVVKEKALTVAQDPIRITLVPENTVAIPGVENRFHLFATDPLGEPIADATVDATLNGGAAMHGTTDPFGHVALTAMPSGEAVAFDVTLTPSAGGSTIVKHFDFTPQTGGEHVLVRTDKSIYHLGDTVKVQVFASNAEDRVYVDWLSEGQAVDMRTLDVTNGTASFDMPLDASLFGENRIEAYVVDADGNTVRAGRTIMVSREGALQVSLSTDQAKYAPGEAAKLTFSVSDQQGKPAAAALGVQIVDEAVFALIDAKPGLLRTYFELEDAFAKPMYEIDAPPTSFDKLLFEDAEAKDQAQAAAAQTRAEASFAALQGHTMMGIEAGSWAATLADVQTKLQPVYEAEHAALVKLLTPYVNAEAMALKQQGCTPDMYYCASLQKDYRQALSERLSGHLEGAIDLWGKAYQVAGGTFAAGQLTTSGPDEVAGNADDATITLAFSDFGGEAWAGVSTNDAGVAFEPPIADGDFAGGPQAAGGGVGNFGGAAGTGGAGAFDNGNGTGSDDKSGDGTPRVRKEFPETLYVNPAIITDADGKATISVDMADSITSWRVSALANAADGKLGGGQSGITVFQDFFVDVSFPAELTRGDEVDFPIVLYNYLKTQQTVKLTIEQAPWFTALGSVNPSVTLAAGEVKSINVPVRVEQVGTQALRVTAIGSKLSDAVERAVRVVPDGKAFPLAQSGSLGKGSTQLTVTFPANAVAGSGVLYLDVFPAFLAQAVSGLDSLLQVPSGCFEQTTSTTWPNVLVEHYMEQTKQITPEIQMKAESLVSAGYQRLLTFEHKGGGFSWFGEQDPAPFLSVTAFGLMEFADMASVTTVDSAMRTRTRDWLVAQQKSDGSWPGDMSEFFSFQTSVARNTAFVVWALAQDGDKGSELQRGLDFVKAHVSSKDDAYTLALAANAYAAAAPNDPETSTLLDMLDAMKTTTGNQSSQISWDTAGTETNFYASGNDSAVSTTALVAHAMILAGGYAGDVKGALEFITAQKDTGGNFGSTQATVWALKTLLLAALHGTDGAVGTLDVQLDGQPFASVALKKADSDVMTRVDMSALAATGAHTIDLTFDGTGKLSYSLVSVHNIPWSMVPAETPGPLSVTVSYDRTQLAVNETVKATLEVANLTPDTQNMVLVTVGIPPGFGVLDEDLDAYLTSGKLSKYEKTGKQLTLYITSIAASATEPFSYRLQATMPVKAADGGAVVYPYYEPDQKSQAESQLLTVN